MRKAAIVVTAAALAIGVTAPAASADRKPATKGKWSLNKTKANRPIQPVSVKSAGHWRAVPKAKTVVVSGYVQDASKIGSARVVFYKFNPKTKKLEAIKTYKADGRVKKGAVKPFAFKVAGLGTRIYAQKFLVFDKIKRAPVASKIVRVK
ncbi:hypothetical protein SMC26_35855 [Actinomadura fulvescens]|uniref:Uncharacterized protein n=1 Tax=Actinomadura fulvescens TaxID=46160 RepID=A0ABP6BJK9_9ACTN